MDAQSAKERGKSMETANQASIYKLILVGLLVSFVGIYLRFAFNSTVLSIVSWAILFAGAFICCKAVFKILNAK